MAEQQKGGLPHLLVQNTASTHDYTRPPSGSGGNFQTPARNRAQHAEHLIEQIDAIRSSETDITGQQRAFGLDVGNGIYLSFESEPDFDLKFQSLEYQPSGIELCAVKRVDSRTTATVFVPEGKLEFFLKKIARYRDQNTVPKSPEKPSRPREQELVESISAIKLAALQELFTDAPGLFPTDGNPIWWEVWLRRSDRLDYEAFLRQHAGQLEMRVSGEALHFLDRSIVLVHGSPEQMTRSIHLLGAIAEVRRAGETAAFYTGMDRPEQREWMQDLQDRTTPPPENAPAVCLLDTGLNERHPLLQALADAADMHSYDGPNWGTDDRYGHGTPMAGLAAYGDLTTALSSSGPIALSHRLESVKIMPDPSHHHKKRLYGAITRESISRVEVERPERQRNYCMAITTSDDLNRGRPSSWSATIDALASGYEDETHRLIVLSAGNTAHDNRHRYPDSNLTDAIHDPGQAWNALTIGGFTDKTWLDTGQYPDWAPVAPAGDLSPCSCTSMEWPSIWPVKPDVVMEAGNMAINPEDGTADYIDDSLQMVSTGHQHALGKQLVSFGDTSGASALAARLAAKVQAQYPDFWPETVRALMVHSARWTAAMQARFLPSKISARRQKHYRQLLRYCGYGVPDEGLLFWSANNSLTLIAQDSLQPFFKQNQTIKTRDINLHTLPWPNEALEALAETTVEMRVTLSYFIEPNPGERGWTNKYRYASHGLRFVVRRPLESEQAFHQRINQKARDQEFQKTSTKESGQWALGEKLHNFGSIHSDTWRGTAIELASRQHVAVYPVLGWWKERANLQRWAKRARYALIVTIQTPDTETDIYTPVSNQLGLTIDIF